MEVVLIKDMNTLQQKSPIRALFYRLILGRRRMEITTFSSARELKRITIKKSNDYPQFGKD